ncbi:MAG: carboxypeptidase regulatory-like domain-containing protein, partial [Bacteroidales bacterium]|nr:carboxypeptidase regulatory-like domain-containing protein [Bacteroidales bacterium]
MKRLSLLLLTILFVHSISAQVVDYSMIERNANTDVKLTLKDSKSSKPVSWASVYLIPAGDTTITHFALSDDRGDVLLEDVPVGKYELNAEIIGYNPHRKTYAIKSHWDAYDLGVIRMEENAEFLDAASVSAIGNPVTVKKDTIEFNASSFRVGENAMLEDLIKKMPGMKVEEDGSVTLNGEKIDKITVGGKTFFFNDPTAALKNLPAKLVDKIKVIDKTKDEAAGSGIVTKDDKEKVMDVELKEEYTEGWYGNAKLGGGSTLNPDNGNVLIDDRGLLYNGNAMVTGYTEKDQVIFLGNAFNAIEPGADVGYYGSSGTSGDFSSLGGLNSTAQAGMNYNTSRIKGMESTLSVNFKNNGKVDKKISSRTSFQPEGPDVLTDGTYDATGSQNLVSASMEIKSKENDKYYLYIMPSASYSTEAVNSSNISTTSSDGSLMNSSEASTVSSGNNLYTNGAVY